MNILHSTPKSDHFHMPAEFEPHQGCIMIWPERSDSWSYGAYDARKAFCRIATAISASEKVIVCASFSQYDNARQMLPPCVRVVEMSSNDAWARDYAPTFVINEQGQLRGIDWGFNAWGGLLDGLYFPWDKDNAMARKLCDLLDADVYDARNFILEGGSIHVDGEGTCMVTESCLLSKGRNPGLSRSQIEDKLRDYLNVDKVLWLPCGIYLDETNEHVDNICAFSSPGNVVLAMTEDVNDPQYDMSMQCLEYLNSQKDAKGRTLTVHTIPMPSPVIVTEADCQGLDNMDFEPTRVAGDRLAASYVNFYIANNAIIMPGFGNPGDACDPNHIQDEKAKNVLQGLFPDREVVQIYTREILVGGGNIHCITQQIPFYREKE